MNDASGQSNGHAAVQEALKRARQEGSDESVIYHLRHGQGSAPPTADETRSLAEQVLQRATNECQRAPKQKTIFQNLGAMAVQGDPELLLKILEQPEVQDASLNHSQRGPVEPIRPVRKGPATSKGWVETSE